MLTFHPFKLEANYESSHNLFKPSFPSNATNMYTFKIVTHEINYKAVRQSAIPERKLMEALFQFSVCIS